MHMNAVAEIPNLAEIHAYIEDSEYDIKQKDEGVFTMPNRAQNLRFTFSGDSFAVQRRDFGERQLKPWDLSIQFNGASKGRRVVSASNPHWSVNRKNAHGAAPGVTIEYQNSTNGLRQNFWIHSRPEGDEPLTLALTVSSEKLNFEVENNQVVFADKNGDPVVAYTDLNVWDANNTPLAASMVAFGGNHFAIVVDDALAMYPIYVDPVTTSVQVYDEGQSGSKFSFSLAIYNRLDGHDHPGIIVGAPYYDTGFTDAGKVFVYYASTSLPSSPTWTKDGDQDYGHFGWSVADAGDTDNNSYNDILIGEPDRDVGEGLYTDAGTVYLFKATSSGINSSFSWSYDIPYYGSHLGYSVSGIGNFNADQYMDFAIGAPDRSPPAVFVFKGTGSGIVSVATLTGSSGSRLGFSLARAGDIDDDGFYDDFVAGAPEHNSGAGAKGAVTVYFSNGTSFTATTINGQNTGDKFGFSVAGSYDVNGDGYPDVLVGAPYHSNGQTAEGKIYLFTGTSSGINTTAYFTDESGQANAHLGWSVAGAPNYGLYGHGDVDFDGAPDFIAGAPDYDATATDSGQAFFYRGGATPVLNTYVSGLFASAHTGTSVALGTVYYRTPGIVVGTPTGNASGAYGGTVQAWKWTP